MPAGEKEVSANESTQEGHEDTEKTTLDVAGRKVRTLRHTVAGSA